MMATLQWATLMVCCAAVLLRVPDAVKGRNRTVFGILLLATLCSLLAVSEIYGAIDGALGGRNFTSLIQRYLIFATVLLVGLRITRGLAAAKEHSLMAGGIGRCALALCCLAVAVTFFLMDTAGVPAGLQSPSGSGETDAELAPYYIAAGRTYPVFVSLVLLPPLLAAVRSQLPRPVRVGALLVFLGAVFAILSFPVSLAPAGWADALRFVNYAAVLGYVGGLVAFWFSGLIGSPSGIGKETFSQNGD
ncbi:MAG: hypothetical protein ABWX85_09555 [Arthrobacter sp.]